MLTKAFWKATMERAIRTFAQTLSGTLGVNAIADLGRVDWLQCLAYAGVVTGLSVLTSVGSATITRTDNPGITEIVAGKGSNG